MRRREYHPGQRAGAPLHSAQQAGATTACFDSHRHRKKSVNRESVGCLYAFGRGVSKDEAEAVKWYRKAAEQGFADAQRNVGVMYAKGDGVVKDEVEAYKWMLLAGAQGEENAKKDIQIFERRLTPSQRAEGQKLAREFKARKTLP